MASVNPVLRGIHEIGHTSAHLYFSHRIDEVAIGSEDGGYCKPTVGQTVNTLDQIVCCCSGKAAVNRLNRRRNSHNWRQSDDFKQALKAALRLSDNNTLAGELLVKWAERMAEVIIDKNWKKVLLLTQALLKKGKLEGEVLNRILGNGKA